MEEMRFAPPKAVVEDRADDRGFRAPPEVMKWIRAGVLGGVVSTGFTFVFTLVATIGAPVLEFSAWNFLDVVLMAGLTFGLYRRSRVCAVVVLAYFVTSKIMMLRAGGNPASLVSGFIFGYLYVQGVRGTFEYHRLRRRWQARRDAQ